MVRSEARNEAECRQEWDKGQGARDNGQFRTPLRYCFVANYEPGVWLVVRHATKRSAVKSGTWNTGQGTRDMRHETI
ncbi:MAG: hypothetical protein NZ781_11250 [Armatimonadetes bacterium]|nr:hypothetical protein [Armatimonadota bacterium]